MVQMQLLLDMIKLLLFPLLLVLRPRHLLLHDGCPVLVAQLDVTLLDQRLHRVVLLLEFLEALLDDLSVILRLDIPQCLASVLLIQHEPSILDRRLYYLGLAVVELLQVLLVRLL